MAMKALLLKNYPSASLSDHLFLRSFSENITNFAPGTQLDVCCIANGEPIPELSDYQLVILSGGKVNLLQDDQPRWVTSVLEMVRKVASDKNGPKLLGICWGHQAIHYALGGNLAWLEDRPRVSYAWRFSGAQARSGFHPVYVSILYLQLILPRLEYKKSNSRPLAKIYFNKDHMWFVP